MNLKTTNCDSIELELEIRPTILTFDKLRQIAERNSLEYRENKGKAIMFWEKLAYIAVSANSEMKIPRI